MKSLRIIGDVHGKIQEYGKIVDRANEAGLYTLQIGDLGFSDTYNFLMSAREFDIGVNKFFRGNHDDYEFETKFPEQTKFSEFNLGEYGHVRLNGVKLFFVRGAFSIDYMLRTPMVDWWENEQIKSDKHNEIIKLYAEIKPDIVVTHDCPDNIGKDGILKSDWFLDSFGYDSDTFSTTTGKLLQSLFEMHQPSEWVFGHYHVNWKKLVNGTRFRCIQELGFLDF